MWVFSFWKRGVVFLNDCKSHRLLRNPTNVLNLLFASCFSATEHREKSFACETKDSETRVSVCYCTACLLAAACHFPSLSQVSPKALGWPTVYNTSPSACCCSMKFLFIEATGVQRVICLFWMRSGGFDKVSWIKALGGRGGGAEGQVTGAGQGEKATMKRLAPFIVRYGQCQHTI